MQEKRLFWLAIVFSLSTAPALAAEGITLRAALAEAYGKNPDIAAARAELKSIDELRIQSAAGFKPAVTAAADYTTAGRKLSTGRTGSDPKTLSLEVTQSLYSGGSTLADVQQSDSLFLAAKAKLRATEQQVFLDGVRAYMVVIRDQRIAELRLSNENVLTNHLRASRERFKLGDITKTDVSQAQSRLASAAAKRIAAAATLEKSRAFFEKIIGILPNRLKKPDESIVLPATKDAALALAEKNNPVLAQALHSENAAKAATRMIEGERLPTVNLTGTVEKVYNPAGVEENENTQSVGIRATLPLYAGGKTTSRIRQSRQVENQLRMAAQSASRAIRQSVVDAWENLSAAKAESVALQEQINAARLALEGVKVELDVGARTTLDLLDAQQEYQDAEVAFVSAETDRIIAAYALSAATGDLTAEALKLDKITTASTGHLQKK